MTMITIEIETNGYEAMELQEMIIRFDRAAEKLFPGCKVCHFFYGDELDMADLIVKPGCACHFNITKNRVSLNGYGGSDEDVRKWQSMTYRDELFNGRLMELGC